MSKKYTGLPLISSVLALIIGLVLGVTIRPARRHAPDAADPAPQPSSPTRRLAPAIDEKRTPESDGRPPATARAARRRLKLPWRADLVVRGGIWAVSIFVIAVYVLSSISRPGPTQVTTSAQSLSYDLPPIPTQAVPGVSVEAEPQDPSQAAQYSLVYWEDALGAWLPVSLYPENPSDDEDESALFMLRIENADLGGIYTFNVRHDCAYGGSYDDTGGDATPTRYDKGPGSSIADSLLTTEDGNFKLWGGSFTSGGARHSAIDLCLPHRGPKADEAYPVALIALSETVYLLWNGHLADLD